MTLAMLAALAFTLSPGQNAGFCGMPRTGKSRSAQQLAERHRRVLTFDPYARDNWDARDRGELCSPWGVELVEFAELMRAPELLERPAYSLTVDPGTLDGPELGKRFGAVAQLAWHTGNLVVVEEELALWGRHAVAPLLQLATGGGHAGISTMCIAQRFNRLPADVRGELNTLVCYAQGEDLDVEALRKRAGKDFAARVARLRVGDRPEIWRLGDALESTS